MTVLNSLSMRTVAGGGKGVSSRHSPTDQRPGGRSLPGAITAGTGQQRASGWESRFPSRAAGTGQLDGMNALSSAVIIRPGDSGGQPNAINSSTSLTRVGVETRKGSVVSASTPLG